MPTAYYHPSGPIGDVVFTFVPDGRFKDVAVIGLGAGALAAYAGKDARMDSLRSTRRSFKSRRTRVTSRIFQMREPVPE